LPLDWTILFQIPEFTCGGSSHFQLDHYFCPKHSKDCNLYVQHHARKMPSHTRQLLPPEGGTKLIFFTGWKEQILFPTYLSSVIYW
jgi:hypothetical protein